MSFSNIDTKHLLLRLKIRTKNKFKGKKNYHLSQCSQFKEIFKGKKNTI